jgi:alanyl aminopeptidase
MRQLPVAGPLVLASTLLAHLVAPGVRAETVDEVRLGTEVVPLRQSVNLRLDPGQTEYSGSTRIEIEVRNPTASFRFHAEEMTLTKVRLQPAAGGESLPLAHEMLPRGTVRVTAPSPLPAGRYTLEMDFANDFGTRAVGLYRMTQGAHGYAFTQMEPDDAREAIPCWDEPGFKIPFDFAISVPEGQVAVFNTQVASQGTADGWTRFVFAETKPLPTYLLAFAAGPLESVEMPGLSAPGRIYTVQGQSALTGLALEMTPPILAALEEYFGEKYPYDKCDFIAIPEYWAGAMENPGAITFNATALLVDPKAASVGQRSTLARFIAHELAHIWFGDVVTMEWWDDLWLNESFADWMGDKIAHRTYPELRLDLTEMRSSIDVMSGDARPSSWAIRRPVTDTSDLLQNIGLQYNKGKAVLGMFEQWLGVETFRRGVLDYLRAHRWGNATSSDLWSALRSASGQDVAAAMNTFLEQPGVPLVAVESMSGNRIRLSQRRWSAVGVEQPALRWRIPVVLRYADDGGVRTQTVLLAEASQEVTLDARGPLRWIHPNADLRGYYRWGVPAATLGVLIGEGREQLTQRERVGLAASLGNMMDAGSLHADAYLPALSDLAEDESALVVSAVLGELERTRLSLVPDDLLEPFAAFVRATLAPAYQRWGVAARPGEPQEVKLARPEILTWLAEWGQDRAVRATMAEIAASYRRDPASADASLVSAAIRVSSFDGDRALFDERKAAFETATVPADRARYLTSLGSFRRPELPDAALAYVLTGPLRPNELNVIPSQVALGPGNADLVFDWRLANYDELARRIPPIFLSFLPYAASGCSLDRLERARAFFSEPSHQVEGTMATLAKVSDQVKECAARSEREGPRAAAYLRGLTGKR